MKHALLYLALVGIPVLLVIGVLHAGGRLEAPVSIGGTWSCDIEGDAVGPLAKLLAAEDAGFRIAQSGSRFDLRPRGQQSIAKGALEGRTLRAAHESQDGHAWRIEATLDAAGKLHGTWAFVSSSTRTLPFTAVRQVSARGKGH